MTSSDRPYSRPGSSDSRHGSSLSGSTHAIKARRSLAAVTPESGIKRPPLPPPRAAATAPADIVSVSSAEELRSALTSGAQDIEIREHLDLEDVAGIPVPEARQGLFDNSTISDRLVFAIIEDPTRSIRVRPSRCLHLHLLALSGRCPSLSRPASLPPPGLQPRHNQAYAKPLQLRDCGYKRSTPRLSDTAFA